MDELIKNSKVILVAGSGGVGKTTISASLGVVAAQTGRKVLVMTIDPSLRLATSLGLNQDSKDVVSVDDNHLFAYLLDSKSSFQSFVKTAIDNPNEAEKLINNKIFKQLSTTLSGSQEFTSLERLAYFHDSGNYDLIILDTPPTQHAIDFLEAPEKLYTLFDDSVLKWFRWPTQNQGLLREIVNRGTKQVFKVFERSTGSDFMNELREFFTNVQVLRQSIIYNSRRAEKVLSDVSTQFILVANGNKSKNRELNLLGQQLKKRGAHLHTVVINKCHPLWFNGEEMVFPDSKITELCRGLTLEYMEKNSRLDQIATTLESGSQFVRIPEFDGGVVGRESLEEFAKVLSKNWRNR